MLNVLFPQGEKEMLSVTQQHLFCLDKAWFLVEIWANECGCVRTLASPVGRGVGVRVHVCVLGGRGCVVGIRAK